MFIITSSFALIMDYCSETKYEMNREQPKKKVNYTSAV